MADTTINLGPEHDAALQRALMNALRELGAAVSEPNWVTGGSQEVMSIAADLGGVRLLIESETYIGLTLTGDGQAIERVAERTRAILATS